MAEDDDMLNVQGLYAKFQRGACAVQSAAVCMASELTVKTDITVESYAFDPESFAPTRNGCIALGHGLPGMRLCFGER